MSKLWRKIQGRMEASSYKAQPTYGEFASETIASSTRSTTMRASWTSVSYDTEAMLIGSGSHAPNHGMHPTAFGGG